MRGEAADEIGQDPVLVRRCGAGVCRLYSAFVGRMACIVEGLMAHPLGLLLKLETHRQLGLGACPAPAARKRVAGR